MTKDEERVVIAKDALAWIEAGALEPYSSVYVAPTRRLRPEDNGKELRDVVLGECRVCALGAMFIAKAVRFDECKVDGVMTFFGQNVRGHLSQYFEREQLGFIEAAFERCGSFASTGDPSTAVAFGRKHRTDRARLIAILRNIIANNGTFCP